MNVDITLFITACGRPDLLRMTLTSFMKYNTYPIKEVIIIEDSGNLNINDFAHEIVAPIKCTLIYNQKRLGQMRSIEKGVSYITTPFVFHCEDDWEFYNSGFIEHSLEILNSDPKISQVCLRSYGEYLNYYQFEIEEFNNPLCKKLNCWNNQTKYNVYTWNPTLKSLYIEKLNMPYADWDDEFTIQTTTNKLGYYAVVSNNILGYVRHIGWHRHIPECADIKYRKDFVDKFN